MHRCMQKPSHIPRWAHCAPFVAIFVLILTFASVPCLVHAVKSAPGRANIFHDSAGNLHINSSSGQAVFLNGVDVVATGGTTQLELQQDVNRIMDTIRTLEKNSSAMAAENQQLRARVEDLEAQIDFIEKTVEVYGDLKMCDFTSAWADVGPSSIRIIGAVTITSCAVSAIVGLENVVAITGGLEIQTNSNLINLNGLSNLETVGWLHIRGNPTLADISGLGKLRTVSSYLNIWANNALTSFHGLDALNYIGGNLDISSNRNLKNLDGLSSLRTIRKGYLVVHFHDELTDISGLTGLQVFGGPYVRICGNKALTAIPSFFTTLKAGLTSSSNCLRAGGNCC